MVATIGSNNQVVRSLTLQRNHWLTYAMNTSALALLASDCMAPGYVVAQPFDAVKQCCAWPAVSQLARWAR
jgi:hypothetical protein